MEETATSNTMTLKSLITSGLVPRPQRITIYGPNGIGKGTLAKAFPSAVFIDAEDGTTHLEVVRIPVNDTMQLFEAVRALGSESHEFKIVIIDTIDAVEKMLRHRVCMTKSVKSIEDIGYGKGWTLLREESLMSPVVHPVIALTEAVADLDMEHVNAFLVARTHVPPGGTIADVPLDYARRALKSLPKFKDAITKFQQGQPPNGEAVPASQSS
jgi:AAA domain